MHDHLNCGSVLSDFILNNIYELYYLHEQLKGFSEDTPLLWYDCGQSVI